MNMAPRRVLERPVPLAPRGRNMKPSNKIARLFDRAGEAIRLFRSRCPRPVGRVSRVGYRLAKPSFSTMIGESSGTAGEGNLPWDRANFSRSTIATVLPRYVCPSWRTVGTTDVVGLQDQPVTGPSTAGLFSAWPPRSAIPNKEQKYSSAANDRQARGLDA